MMPKVSEPDRKAPSTKPGMSNRALTGSELSGRTSGTGEGEYAEEDVEPEDGTPGPAVHQEAPDERTEREPEARYRHPDAERPSTLPTVGIEVPDHRQRAGLGGGGTDAHDDPAGDEDVGRRGDRGDDRPGAEDGHAGQHHLLAPEEVADGAEAQHEAGEGQGVAVHHPLQLAHRCMQVCLHIGEHHRHDGVVEKGQEENEQESGQGQRRSPAGPFAGLRAGGRRGDGQLPAHRRSPWRARVVVIGASWDRAPWATSGHTVETVTFSRPVVASTGSV